MIGSWSTQTPKINKMKPKPKPTLTVVKPEFKEQAEALPFHPSDKKISYEVTITEPHVTFTKDALRDIYQIVDLSDKEIGWMGIVERDGMHFRVTEILMPKQTANMAECEFTTDGMAEIQLALLERPNGDELANQLKLWGHSHVDMGVFASPQDKAQIEDFKENGNSYFLRMIANKKGDISLSLFLFDLFITCHNVGWSVETTPDTGRRERWKQDITDKVQYQSYASIIATYPGERPPSVTYPQNKQPSVFGNDYGHLGLIAPPSTTPLTIPEINRELKQFVSEADEKIEAFTTGLYDPSSRMFHSDLRHIPKAFKFDFGMATQDYRFTTAAQEILICAEEIMILSSLGANPFDPVNDQIRQEFFNEMTMSVSMALAMMRYAWGFGLVDDDGTFSDRALHLFPEIFEDLFAVTGGDDDQSG